jgi:hypothetical protein
MNAADRADRDTPAGAAGRGPLDWLPRLDLDPRDHPPMPAWWVAYWYTRHDGPGRSPDAATRSPSPR